MDFVELSDITLEITDKLSLNSRPWYKAMAYVTCVRVCRVTHGHGFIGSQSQRGVYVG